MVEGTDRTCNEIGGDVPGLVVQAANIQQVTVAGMPSTGVPVRPALLPPDVSFFTGRSEELGKLDVFVDDRTSTGAGAAVVISAIAGAGGMGKTALVVHWAHRVRDRFPDGQLYVDLRGYGPHPPLDPAQALQGFLRALGVPGAAIPHDVQGMTGMYRSILADRRMLVLLDNAATSDQVRPLLPNGSTCLVLITSRSLLSGLVVREGAHRIALDQLSPREAVNLLRVIIGSSRVDAEQDAAGELARRCAGLPLALCIAAERVAARPHARISDLAAGLAGQDRLDMLTVRDDETTAVRAVFDWSYRTLSESVASVFRLLGLHPGPTVSVPAAAALAGTTTAEVLPLLDALTCGHLLAEIGRGRYQFHDLLRDYAAEQAHLHDSETVRSAAVRRALMWYMHTAYAASRLLYPDGAYRSLDASDAEIRPLVFTSREDAFSWCDAEIANLLAAVRCAADYGFHDLAARLPRTISTYLVLRARWSDAFDTSKIGLDCAERSPDPYLELEALAGLGDASFRSESFADCTKYLQRQLALSRELESRKYEAMALHALGLVFCETQRFTDAAEHCQAALPLYREIGNSRGEALMLGTIGDVRRRQGRFDDALVYFRQSLTILRRTNNRWNEALCLRWLGLVYTDLRQFDEAIMHLSYAGEVYRELDDRYEAARTLHALGDTLHTHGQLDQALEAWRKALALYDELHAPQASAVRARLPATTDSA